MHPMTEFVGGEVDIVGSFVDGRKPVPHTMYWYRYPNETRVYEIRFDHAGRNKYQFHSSNDPKVGARVA